MIETWRWYGGLDKLKLDEIKQTGASGIVSALHEIPYGEVWSVNAIANRRSEIERAGFDWSVVESLPVHEDIKRGTGDLKQLFANYRQSLANLAEEGLKIICYNFMPLLDWTRTDLHAPVKGGGTCLRFSAVKMAAFELYMLGRTAAEGDYSDAVVAQAADWFRASTDAERELLLSSIMAGMPGAYDRYDIAGLQTALDSYSGADEAEIRANFKRFLEEVVPTAEALGMKLCVHPDDPPRDILGLPRIVSDDADIRFILDAYDSPANGLTLCTGSLGANPKNDPVKITKTYADRVHFAHLRAVKKDDDGSFEEAAHMDGDTDLVAVLDVLLAEEKRRHAAGRTDSDIPFRPDHGHELLSDNARGTFPGYPMIGRLRGLAELRGAIRGLKHHVSNQ